MNTVKKTTLILTSFVLVVLAGVGISCNSKFPPKAPETGSYGDALWKIDHFITNQKAAQLITNFKSNRDAILSGRYNGNSKVLFDHETFNLRDITELLKVKGCIGLRVNMGMDENNQVRLVLIGVDKDGKELVEYLPGEAGRPGKGGADVPLPPGKSYVEDGQRWP
jgi:hypothetical protein